MNCLLPACEHRHQVLALDDCEQYDIADKHPEVITRIKEIVEQHRKTLTPVDVQLDKYPPGQLPGAE